MKKLFIAGLLALPLGAMAEEAADTTVVYNGKQFVISEDSMETRVKVFDSDGTEWKKSKESTFANNQEVERFYVSSPFFNTAARYEPTTPIAYGGFTGLSGSALGFGNAEGLPTRLMASFEAGIKVFDVGFWLNKKNTWSLSLIENLKWSSFRFSNGYALVKDARERAALQPVDGARSSRLFALGGDIHLMLKWYKYFNDPEADRLCIGLGLTMSSYNLRNNFSSYLLDDFDTAAGSGLKLQTNFGLRLQASWSGFSFYMQKAVTPLFKNGYGPKCYPFSLGLGVAF